MEDFIMLRKKLCIIVSVFLVVVMAGICFASDAETASEGTFSDEAVVSDVLNVAIMEITNHGNVKLNTTFDEMNSHDMEVADIITVSVGEDSYDIPIGTAITDVDSGEMLCWFDEDHNEVELIVNLNSFAEITGIGQKRTIEEDPGFEWDIKVGEVGLSLKEKQGYQNVYEDRQLSRTNAREDYPELTDEEFANFRAFCTEGGKEPVFYRSSTPLNPDLGRNEYVMAAMEKAGIRTVINLNDSVERMENYTTYPESYYSRCSIINPQLNYDFGSEEFSEKVKEIIVFITENDGPYLIHCNEGKDRTGILCALMEFLVGESMEEVVQDYMLSYRNFYKIQPGDENYDTIVNTNLKKTLCKICQIDNIETADMQKEAEEYFISIGITKEQLDTIRRLTGE